MNGNWTYLQRTQPSTCSVAFCSQWPTAYSKVWYHFMYPLPRQTGIKQTFVGKEKYLEENEVVFWKKITGRTEYLKPLNYDEKEKEAIRYGLLGII